MRRATERASRLTVVAGLLALSLAFAARPARGQRADSGCTYTACALSIAPRLAALDVVRGAGEEHVASLAFLWPSNVARVFRGDTLAVRFAERATARRRVALFMTDGGGALAAWALASGLSRRGGFARGDRWITAAGGALVLASVPVHFAADADLSRAVWRFNLRFAR